MDYLYNFNVIFDSSLSHLRNDGASLALKSVGGKESVV